MKALGYVHATRDYEWSAVGVWKDEKGYWIATDSGCSCNWAFQYLDSEDNVDEVYDPTGPLTAQQARDEVSDLTAETSWYYGYDESDIRELLEAIT